MWDFLDVMNKNLLYKYADVLIKGQPFKFDYPANAGDDEKEEYKKQVTCWLIWFTYRYTLGCKTLEETIPYQNKETLKKYRLLSFITNTAIFLCNGEVCFRKPEDISMILEILYNRYGLWEQFDCVIRNTSGVRRKRCIEAKEKYMQLYENYERRRNFK